MMRPAQWLHNGAQMIETSPLAAAKEKAIEPMVREAARLKQELANPVRIALLGEVKAGKSTLVNALVGEKVAPTDVLEATAVVQLLRHGPSEGIIVYKDGRRESLKPVDLYSLLDDNRGDVQFANSIERVELSLPLPGLESIEILDTPGLASMSATLSQKTLEEIATLDVVVWVFNAHHAGAQDVLEAFERVASTGRPIVIVVNRIDELAGDVSLVLQQIEDRLDPWNVEAILPTNAKGSAEGKNESVRVLRKKLEEFASAPDETKLKSTCNQMDVLLHSAAELHRARREAVEVSRAKRETLRSRIVRAGQFVTDEVESKVRRYVFEELFVADQQRLQERAKLERRQIPLVSSLGSAQRTAHSDNSPTDAELNSIFENFGSRLRDEIQPALMAQVNVWMEESWRREGHQLQNALLGGGPSDSAAGAHDHALWMHLEEMERTLGSLRSDPEWEPVLKETAVWGGAGTALAAYSAWLGANAAFIGIGSALSTIVPPLLAVGATVGVVKVIFDRNKQNRKRVATIDDAFRDLRKIVWDELWVKRMHDDIVSLNKEHVNKLLSAEQAEIGSNGLCPDALISWADEAESFRRTLSTLDS